MRPHLTIYLLCLSFALGCKSQVKNGTIELTRREKFLCDSLKFDTTILKGVRKYNSSKFERFHYSLGKNYQNGEEIEADPIYLKGVIFTEKYQDADNLVLKLHDNFKAKGYSIFVVEHFSNVDNRPDNIAILKTIDKYEILRLINTDGINYNITNDSLLTIIKMFDKKYSLELIGASGDWCEFIIKDEPKDWMTFANEVYKVCPDAFQQGPGNIQALAGKMKRTKRLYFWWD